MQAYSDPSRKADPHALPDVEIFYDDADIPEWGGQARNYDVNGEPVKARLVLLVLLPRLPA